MRSKTPNYSYDDSLSLKTLLLNPSSNLSPSEYSLAKNLYNFMLKNSDGLGVSLPVLLRFYCKLNKTDFKALLQDRTLYMRYYMRIRRFISSLASKGLVEVSKLDGFLWIKPKVDWIHH